MVDSLFSRSDLAIDKSFSLREERRSLQRSLDHEREKLRLRIWDMESDRVEKKAHRDNCEGAVSPPFDPWVAGAPPEQPASPSWKLSVDRLAEARLARDEIELESAEWLPADNEYQAALAAHQKLVSKLK